ncbi:MAG: pyruvate, phosphate dikinase [Candidatus Heimdallarchaeum endolithica]|uniref:pyruvate, phosphate dikinase n=1 Tax=Candidatus Heimdallarchaeum endolithica TaxID=2876572 RepID=A0A9Y1FN92_9ARCH|nr:MAG: pyruvate, phosphate dikinase [Candidatus Heimdallarchaeum endolithica]
MSEKYVYRFFSKEKCEGSAEMKNLLGGKGANLAQMTSLGLPVPPGFVISTKACLHFLANNNEYPEGLSEQIEEALTELEQVNGKKLGDNKDPLLVSVRSGAAISMPGMMDTVLNLGLNDVSVEGLAKKTSNPRFAYDAYRRFIYMFADVVMGLSKDYFEKELEKMKEKQGVKFDSELSAEALKELVEINKKVYEEHLGEPFPQDPKEQLDKAIRAVFNSWNNKRAIDYRNYHGISHDLGTAVNVQTMVFGNMGDDSATGVAFTRNPSTGDKQVYGEYLVNAQGEDVVAGIRTPEPISHLKDHMPEVYNQLIELAQLLENRYRDMQDMEFTIQQGKLYLLQTRNGKRTGIAAGKIAYDLVQEGLITKEEAILRISASDVDNCLFPSINWAQINPNAPIKSIKAELKKKQLGKGLPAGAAAACGIAYFTADGAKEAADRGEDTILVRVETTPEDFHGMAASKGILTMKGGLTSHAAIVARQIGKACIVGSERGGITIDLEAKEVRGNGLVVKEGEWITIDGTDGAIYQGKLPTTPAELPEGMQKILEWADEYAKLKVRANADKPDQFRKAIEFGATGIGLCRTEHMFFDHLDIVREMILARSEEERKIAVDKLEPFQEKDFEGLFEAAEGRPVIIRLIDPPLHEFLPSEEELLIEIYEARLAGKTEEDLKEQYNMLEHVRLMKEQNPMLGLRGCRLGITMPIVTEMQSRAIFRAAAKVKKKGIEVMPEVMVPLVGFETEFKHQRKIIDRIAKEIMKEEGVEFKYLVGTMIEVPRAAITAADIAKGEEGAEFFSFGTNDLHQMTLGFSRDDAGPFINKYLSLDIMPADPFVTIDQVGVGRLMQLCVSEGRLTKPDLEIGICGEQGGEPKSIEFCHKIGLNYVSCSPYRVPIARLAAAHSALKDTKK